MMMMMPPQQQADGRVGGLQQVHWCPQRDQQRCQACLASRRLVALQHWHWAAAGRQAAHQSQLSPRVLPPPAGAFWQQHVGVAAWGCLHLLLVA